MWREKLAEVLPLLGHRNWILVVDKAFPWQSSAGMTYIDTGKELPNVLKEVLAMIKSATHIRPSVYLDKELEYLDDSLCSGIQNLRSTIYSEVNDAAVIPNILPHEEVFARLDTASKLFTVVVLKTETILPYTSVFIELDCGYWNEKAEKELRRRMSI